MFGFVFKEAPNDNLVGGILHRPTVDVGIVDETFTITGDFTVAQNMNEGTARCEKGAHRYVCKDFFEKGKGPHVFPMVTGKFAKQRFEYLAEQAVAAMFVQDQAADRAKLQSHAEEFHTPAKEKQTDVAEKARVMLQKRHNERKVGNESSVKKAKAHASLSSPGASSSSASGSTPSSSSASGAVPVSSSPAMASTGVSMPPAPTATEAEVDAPTSTNAEVAATTPTKTEVAAPTATVADEAAA